VEDLTASVANSFPHFSARGGQQNLVAEEERKKTRRAAANNKDFLCLLKAIVTVKLIILENPFFLQT
jgi:hypothetical protein